MRCAGELTLGKSWSKDLIRDGGCVYRAVGHSRRDGCAAHGTEESSLKRFIVWRIRADQVGHAARQDIAENPEAGAEYGFRLDLPRDCRSRLQNGQRRGREEITEMSLNRGVQRLIDIM